MIFTWISKNKCHWPVRVMCHVLQVSSSGYYKWCRNTTGRLMAAREVALLEIKAIHAEVKERYGSPRIHQELKKRGFKTSLNTVAKIIRKNHIQRAASSGFRICRTTTTVSPKPIKTDSSGT